jgi:hypothetical protein
VTLFLNAASEPGFVAAEKDGAWTVLPADLSRGAAFIGTAVERLLAPEELRALGSIVVVNGPGSSTGLRIVCAYANALALVSGASLRALPTFELVRRLHPAHPGVLAFSQPLGRTVRAVRQVDGSWESMDAPAAVPEENVSCDALPLPDADDLEALIAAAAAVEVATPRYWAPPMISSRKH